MRLADLRENLQLRRGDRSYSAKALTRFINQAYLDIGSRRRWGWLRRVHRHNVLSGASFTGVGWSSGADTLLFPTLPTTPVWGHRVHIDGRIYTIENLRGNGTTAVISPDMHDIDGTGGPGTTTVKVVNDEVCLPLGGATVLEARLIRGLDSIQLSAVEPWKFARRDRNTFGMPSHFSVINKQPLPVPHLPPTLTLGAATGGPDGTSYTYWFSFYDHTTGAESALSPPATITKTAGRSVQIDVPYVNPASPATAYDGPGRRDFWIRHYRSKNHTADETPQPYFLETDSDNVEVYIDNVQDNYLGRRATDSPSSTYLRLYPIPDAAYQIEIIYQADMAEMGDDDDRPMFDAMFHPIVLDGAEALLLEAHDEYGRAQHARARFDQGIARMIQQDKLSQRTIVGITPNRRHQIRAGQTAEWWEFP